MSERLRKSPVIRVVAAVIFFGGLGLLVVRHLTNAPSEVELKLALGSAAPQLQHLALRASRQDQHDSIAFRFERSLGSNAPRTLATKLKLADGDYRVEIDLRYRGEPPKRMRTRATSLGPRALRILRRMSVRGSGSLTIVIGED